MQLDAVTAELRPRSDWEAVDLGFALVRRDFWRCFVVWWLAMLLPTLVFGYLLWDVPAVFLFVFWWLKPAGTRMVLFEISRRLFGEKPPWQAVWRELPRVWTRRFLYRFFWARLSPWFPVTLAVEDLEGLRGSAYTKRCRQVARRGEGVAMSVFFSAELIAGWLALALLGLLLMMMPQGLEVTWQMVLESWDPTAAYAFPPLIIRAVCVSSILAISLTDLFLTGSGFGIYINNRTWLEGWDVEIAFKRLTQRLVNTGLIILLFSMIFCPQQVLSAEGKSPQEVIEQVKNHPDFKVHTVMERVQTSADSSKAPPSWLFEIGQWLMTAFATCAVIILVGLVGWAVWKNRHSLVLRRGMAGAEKPRDAARMVLGMQVSSATLPADVPAAAWALWQGGGQQEALALLYRGAISRIIEMARVDIQESDTEGDCLRRVESAGGVAHPMYFRRITAAWSGLAYAGLQPADGEVKMLCEQWPFSEGRPR